MIELHETQSFYSPKEEEPAQEAGHGCPPSSEPAPVPESGMPDGLVKVAGAVSSVFSPLLLPTYCSILAMWTTPLHVVSESARLTTALMVLVLTCFLPLASLMAFVRLGKVADTKVRDRRQRYLLYPVAVIAYGVTALYLHHIHAPGWLAGFFLGACLASICAMAVNFRWKISAHATCCGGLVGMCFFIAASGLNDFFFLPWLTGAVMVLGVVCTSRLILKAHTPGQLAAGSFLGIAAVVVMMWLFM